MKRLLKVLCIMMVMVFCVTNVKYAYAEGMSTRTIIRYLATGESDSGRIKVYANLVVQDSSNEIIDYSIADITGVFGVSNTNVVHSEITNNGTMLLVEVEYDYKGSYQIEAVYIDM